MNTAILGERSAGIGFAIPIDRARRIADDLIAHGEVREGYLGVAVEDLPAREGGAGGILRGRRGDGGRPGLARRARRGPAAATSSSRWTGSSPPRAEEFRFRVRDLGIGQDGAARALPQRRAALGRW